MLAAPPIEFAQRGGTHLAYQVAGTGPPDIVYVGGSFAATLAWDEDTAGRGFRRLASFSRLITYDQVGMGYSDPIDSSAVPTVDELVADLEVVIGAAGVTDPVLFGAHNGAGVAAVYASRHPVNRLIMCNGWARLPVADDYPIGIPRRAPGRVGGVLPRGVGSGNDFGVPGQARGPTLKVGAPN